MPKSKNSQSGFSLVELLVAVVVLAVGLLALAQLQVTAMKTNSQSTTKTAATALVQQAIEQVLSWDADDARLQASGTGVFTWSPVDVEGAGRYNVEWKVTTPYDDVTNLCRIDITVESTRAVMGILENTVKIEEGHTFRRRI